MMYVCMYALAHDDGMFTSVDLHLMGMYVCIEYVCMYVCKTLKLVEYNCIGGGGSYKGGAVPPTDLRGIAQ